MHPARIRRHAFLEYAIAAAPSNSFSRVHFREVNTAHRRSVEAPASALSLVDAAVLSAPG